MKSALGYVEETLLNAEFVKLIPKWLAPIAGGILSSCLSSHKTFFRSLIPATEQRIQEKNLKNLGHKIPERVRSSPYHRGLFSRCTTLELTSNLYVRRIVFNGLSIRRRNRPHDLQKESSTS